MTKNETLLDELKINYLTEAQYNAAKDAGEINEDEIYMTPSSNADGGGTDYSKDIEMIKSDLYKEFGGKFYQIHIAQTQSYGGNTVYITPSTHLVSYTNNLRIEFDYSPDVLTDFRIMQSTTIKAAVTIGVGQYTGHITLTETAQKNYTGFMFRFGFRDTKDIDFIISNFKMYLDGEPFDIDFDTVSYGTGSIVINDNPDYSYVSKIELLEQTVNRRISSLNSKTTGTPSASKTMTSFSQADGIVTTTFSDIQINREQVTGLDLDINNIQYELYSGKNKYSINVVDAYSSMSGLRFIYLSLSPSSITYENSLRLEFYYDEPVITQCYLQSGTDAKIWCENSFNGHITFVDTTPRTLSPFNIRFDLNKASNFTFNIGDLKLFLDDVEVPIEITGVEGGVGNVVIEKIEDQNGLIKRVEDLEQNGGGSGGASIIEVTSEEYSAIVEPDANTIYLITDGAIESGMGVKY